jgi:hypothetical protein
LLLCVRCVLSVFAGYPACVALCLWFAAHCVPVCLLLGVLSLQPSDCWRGCGAECYSWS